MFARLWQLQVIRLLTAWFVVVVLPAIILWHKRIWHWHFDQTNINSFIAMSMVALAVVFVLDKITTFPGQRSFIYIFPVWLIFLLIMATLFLVFRWQYAVYYITLTICTGISYSFISVNLDKKYYKKQIAYIPLGRCRQFGELSGIKWSKLEKPQLDSDIDAVVADLSSSELNEQWQRFLSQVSLARIPVYNHLQIQESLTGRSPIQHLHENDLGSLLPSQSYLYLKQLIESVFVLISLPIIIPIMLLTAILIRLESKGNIIFVQERVGQGGKLFRMYKFRSMTVDAEKDGAKLAQKNDARVTRIGRFIRQTRIDELPQIWNVLKGDMSLIGPRPEQKDFVEAFEKDIPFYNYRHIVKPGITGWAQVMQGYAGNSDETSLKIQYDFYYIKHFSFTLDMMIVVKTIQVIFNGFGAR